MLRRRPGRFAVGTTCHSVHIELSPEWYTGRAPPRKKGMALVQDRRIDAILVTELTRWGRSTTDLVQTLQNLQTWNVSLIAQTGLQFDLSTS